MIKVQHPARVFSARLNESPVKCSARCRKSLPVVQLVHSGALSFRSALPCAEVLLRRTRRNTFPLPCLLCCRRAAATLLIVSASCVRLPASDCGLLAKTMALFFPPTLKERLNHLAPGGSKTQVATRRSHNMYSSACDDLSC